MRIAAALLISLCAASIARAQKPAETPAASAPAKPAALGQAASATIANSFATAESWSLQAMALLSLGTDWHPIASPSVQAALASKEARLQVYALEQLRRTDSRVIGSVATKEILDEIVGKLVTSKNAFVRNRAVEVLERVIPGIDGSKPSTIPKWWAQQRETYAPTAWTPADSSGKEGGTATAGIMEKAFDLRDAGLQVVFVVDSTGSMQLAIDAVRDAIGEISAILGGIAPKLEVGLVHYKDFGDMGDPAEVLVPLTKNTKTVREKLAKLRAGGGGDEPERVEHGVQAALDKSMGWDKEKNRMLLIVGDAPPHPDVHDGLIGLVRSAYEKPFQDPKRPTTGKQEKLRPFITSTIATSPRANPWFEQIAEAGGGTMVLLDMGGPRPGGPPKASDAKPVPKEEAPERIAKHVLRLSFGPQFAPQIDLFVDTFFDYRRAGAF